MKEETIKKWILLANGDFRTAYDEIKTNDPITNTICFHCQQTVEKYLKAYLIFCNIPISKTHDIAQLIEIYKKQDESFENLYQMKANKLTRYAVEVRYPNDFYIPSIEEAEEAISIAEKVKEFVFKKLIEKGYKN